MTRTGRRLVSAVITALACAVILLTLLAFCVNDALVNQTNFADRAVTVLRTSSVDSLVVERVTDDVVGHSSYAASARPTIEAAIRTVVSGPVVTAELRSAVRTLQAELTSGTATQLTLSLPDAGASIASEIESESPELAAEIRAIGTINVVDVRIPATTATIFRAAASIGKHRSPLLILAVALIVLALLISPSRRRTLVRLGLGAVLSGLLVVAFYLVGRGIVVDEFSGQDARTVAGVVWKTYLGGVEVPGFVLAGVGALLAAAAALL